MKGTTVTTSCRLTIFEGADGSGKTTAAKEFAEKTGARYVHFGAFPGAVNIGRFYVEAMLPALLGYQDVVFDRSWLDELPYGQAFRHGADRIGPAGRRMLKRLAMRCGALVVLCSPPWEKCRDNYLSRRHIEYLKDEDQLRHVYDYFASGKGAVEAYPLNYPYDYTKEAFPDPDILDRSRMPRHPLSIQTAGNWLASTVLVGEKFTEPGDTDTFYQWPFASFETGGCSRWLATQLDDGEIPEHTLLWVNSDQDLTTIHHPTRRKYIALGSVAVAKLEKLGWPYEVFSHPQRHKRFFFNQPYPLIEFLKGEYRPW